MRFRLISAPLLLATTLLAAGCGDKDGDDTADTVDTSTTDDTSTDEYSFATDIQPILSANCDGCHIGGGSSGGLTMDAGYSAIVGVPSSTGTDYIEPGDTGTSYLWHKINGTQTDVGGSGGQMPQGGQLSQADLDTIEAWILAGAPE